MVTKDYLTAADELIALKRPISKPHVVILGAGASLAAFPNGDANGHRLPLMKNAIEVIGLRKLLSKAGLGRVKNFEVAFSRLHSLDPESPVLREVEHCVTEYFAKLSLPDEPTIYDQLLLSLRGKDAVFTFNWDPFLSDAYVRNVDVASLPPIFHLHGGVRVGFCDSCRRPMEKADTCVLCEKPQIPTRLLYPIETKNYSADPFISTQWKAARVYLREAFLVTIFGYGAPKSDREAMSIIREAWKNVGHDRLADRVEIVDIRDHDELARQWYPFAYYGHYDIRRDINKTYLGLYPRRSCEALFENGIEGRFVEKFNAIERFGDFANMARALSEYEQADG